MARATVLESALEKVDKAVRISFGALVLVGCLISLNKLECLRVSSRKVSGVLPTNLEDLPLRLSIK